MMKSLLICTDFSKPSLHAAKYGCVLARIYGFGYITLFHAYQVIMPTAGLPVTLHTIDEVERAALKQLEDLEKELQPVAGPEIIINVRSQDVSLGESINRICQQENCDMVVMGMKGKSNLEKMLTGSNTVNVAENSYFPVLIVPAEASLQPVRRMLVACALSKVTETIPAALMHEVLDMFDAPLTVLNIDHQDKHFSPKTPDDLYRLHHIFDKYNPQYAFTENKNTVSGILEYAHKNDISLIIAMPKNYNFFEGLFHKRISEQLIYHSDIPVLTLHAPG